MTTILALAAAAIILSRQDQINVCREFQETGSEDALNRLISSNIRMAIKISRKYQRAGLSLEEMTTEAVMGIMEAAEKYDFDSKASFTSYASLWMRAKVQAHVQANVTPVHIGSRAARKLYASLPKLRRTHGDDLTPAQIAEHLKLSESEVVELLPVINHGGVSMDLPVGEDGRTTIGDLFEDTAKNAEDAMIEREERSDLLSALENFAESLNERDSQIYEGRILAPFRGEDPTPAKELAEIFGVSKQRMSQLEKRVRENLKSHLKAA